VAGEPNRKIVDNERIAILETKLDATVVELKEAVAKLSTLHDLYMQAKGANYFMHVLTAIAAFTAAKFGHLFFSTPVK
jgi:hypothetical protein